LTSGLLGGKGSRDLHPSRRERALARLPISLQKREKERLGRGKEGKARKESCTFKKTLLASWISLPAERQKTVQNIPEGEE